MILIHVIRLTLKILFYDDIAKVIRNISCLNFFKYHTCTSKDANFKLSTIYLFN